ncbi:MAG: isochorismatase family protein [bacterium]
MKDKYFTEDNIKTESLKMMVQLSNSHGSKLKMRITKDIALIVTDMQNYFLDENSHAFVPSAQAIIPGIKSLINSCRNKNIPVIFTKHTNNEANAGAMSRWWRDLMHENSNQCEIYSEFNTDSCLIIEKHQYDAFYQTELKTYLVQNNIKQVIVTGVLTHLCCETTARSAFVNGYDVFFPINGTATYKKNYHRSSLLNLSHGFAVPCLIEDLITQIESL